MQARDHRDPLLFSVQHPQTSALYRICKHETTSDEAQHQVQRGRDDRGVEFRSSNDGVRYQQAVGPR